AQQRVQALDGGDHHLGVRIDTVAAQMLNNVGVGEAVGRTVRLKVLVLLQRLVAQVVTVDQEEDAPGPGVLEQPPGKGAGGEGLTSAGGELDQSTGFVLSQGSFQALDGINLTITQAMRV